MNRCPSTCLLVAPAWFVALAGLVTAADREGGVLQDRLAAALPRLGHRNWIVVADSAYPEQIGGGIETVHVGGDQLAAVAAVLAAIDASGHVAAAPLIDAELAAVAEADAPGVDDYRRRLTTLLEGRPVDKLPHEEIIRELDEAGRLFRVLVLKTDMSLPYTSVFIRLECGYWSPEKEARLRRSLERSAPGRGRDRD